MRRAEIMAVARTQETDARCINPWRGMARRGNRLGATKVRQHLRKVDAKSFDCFTKRLSQAPEG